MDFPIRMKIFDPDAVLTATDQMQLESMISEQMGPSSENIYQVRFTIELLGRSRRRSRRFRPEHLVTMEAYLKGGTVVQTLTTRFSKGAALVASVEALNQRINERIRFESSWLYRLCRTVKRGCQSALSSTIKFFFPGQTQGHGWKPN